MGRIFVNAIGGFLELDHDESGGPILDDIHEHLEAGDFHVLELSESEFADDDDVTRTFDIQLQVDFGPDDVDEEGEPTEDAAVRLAVAVEAHLALRFSVNRVSFDEDGLQTYLLDEYDELDEDDSSDEE